MRSLRHKMIIPFLAGMAALTLILSAYVYFSTCDSTKASVLQLAEIQTQQAAGSINLTFRSLLSTAQNIALDRHLANLFAKPGDSEQELQSEEWLQLYAQSNDYLRDISILDLAGVCIVSSNPEAAGKSYLEEEHVQRALRGLINFGESSVGLATNKLSTIMACPIDQDGRLVGVLVIGCVLPNLVDYSHLGRNGEQGVATWILDASGKFVIHDDSSYVLNPPASYQDLHSELSRSGTVGQQVEYEFAGHRYVGYAMLENISRWLIISGQPHAGILAPAGQAGIMVLAISLAVMTLLALVLFLVSNSLVHSLRSMTDYAKKVADGNFDKELYDSQRSDELGELQTALKKLVQSLRSMLNKSEEGSRMKGEFLANMSHEIRTPLNAIIGLAYLSQRETDISDKQMNNLEQIQAAAKSLLGVLNDILDISKIESGKLALEEAKFNLRETLEQVIGIHEMSAKAKGLRLEMEYDPMLPDRFVGDSVRIGQIVNNLLSNSVKFTNTGSVKIRVSAVGGLDEQGRMQFRLSVIDTGIGINRKALESLFQPFTQADASITRTYGGTGLGLAISDRLVHLMNGVFSVDSEPDMGSTFSFSVKMPVDMDDYDPLDIRGQGDAFSSLDLTGKWILIVEDNQLNQMILEELITPSKADILTADNGLEAVETMTKRRFDLIFMDMQMPIMDGLKATEVIRRSHTREQLPIIAVTANAMKEDIEKAFACGMNDYLTKPIEPNHLAELLYKWLGTPQDKS